MTRILRWAGFGLAGLVALAVLAAAVVYGWSEIILRTPEPRSDIHIVAANDPGAIARGGHLAKIYGCHDCHGADLTGKLFFDQMPVARIAGPNLTLAAARQSDADLARAIRTGVGADGRALWIMPSDAFARLSDAETADIIAYVRTFPAKGSEQPRKVLGPVGRIGALIGKFQSAPARIRRYATSAPPELGVEHALGRQLVRACMECHGADLKGSAVVNSPDLRIAAAYDLKDFERLLRTGVAAGDRRLGLMSDAAPGRFNLLTHDEIAALHGYLKARAEAGN
jgi:mono/diheme cytochrome c family protein